MLDHQREFIELALAHDVLRFGDFTLKSGRRSPYFFNAGQFSSGAALAGLGRAYAATIVQSGLDVDVVFGPAYKGIPIAAATAVQLAEAHGRDVPWSFNRKEAKDHGEGGLFVGAPVTGRVVIVDDVITAGTAIGEVLPMLREAGADPVAVVVGIDRQERLGDAGVSAAQAVRAEHGIAVHAIVTLDDVVAYLEETGRFAEHLPAMRAYREEYGAS